MSIPEKIQREVASLRKAINHHNRLYHAHDNPEIPDSGILEFWNSRILEMADLKA